MSKSPETDQTNYGILGTYIGYRLRRAQLTVFKDFEKHCADFGITPGVFGVLSIVECHPGLTQKAIANMLGNDPSVMVSIVNHLEEMKVVERKTSETDRRSRALFLTRYGEKFYQELLKHAKLHEDEFSSVLKEGEKELLIDMLTRLAEHKPSTD